jgi:hypothetical protein
MVKQGLSVHIRAPPLTLFCLRPEDAPKTQLPGPQNGRKWIQPFGINPTLYNYFLDIGVPATIAVIYLVSVTLLSRLNNSRKNKPWKFSKSSTFKALVLCHNISLALYSGWTFLGLSCTINGNWPSKRDSTFSAQVADSLCRISRSNGPVIARSFMKNNHFPEMPVSILPESSGLWDSGLAYFSWLFYMSKFYEVVDTLIILAKGKSSSILQTYHHAGAMICMWAGVRYMSPPGLVGCLLNSAIHTLMVRAIYCPAFDGQIIDIIQKPVFILCFDCPRPSSCRTRQTNLDIVANHTIRWWRPCCLRLSLRRIRCLSISSK